MTVGVHDMTAGAAKGEKPTAKHSQHLGEMHGARHPARCAKVSNSESKFRLQARYSLPLHYTLLSPSASTPSLSLCTHSRSGLGCGAESADVASFAVARGDVDVFLGPRFRALLPCAGVPSASVGSPGRITIRAARKLSLQAEPLQRGPGLEVPRRTPRTWWPHGGRRTPRLATAARAVARGLHVHTPRLCARGLPMCRHHLYMGKWCLQPQHLLQ